MGLSPELFNAITIAKRAGSIILDFYTKEYQTWQKANGTYLTEADLAAEEYIRLALREQSPYPILSEETDDDLNRLDSDYVWIVDPLDGTRDFIKRTDDFSVLIGLCRQHEPILGVIYLPTKDVLYYAEQGQGANCQLHNRPPRAMRVSGQKSLKEITLLLNQNNVSSKDLEIAKALGGEPSWRFGSIGQKLAFVADGVGDVYVNSRPQVWEWDMCAADIIVREAGGQVTDLTGNPLRYNQAYGVYGSGVVASNGLLHGEVIREIGVLTFANKGDILVHF